MKEVINVGHLIQYGVMVLKKCLQCKFISEVFHISNTFYITLLTE